MRELIDEAIVGYCELLLSPTVTFPFSVRCVCTVKEDARKVGKMGMQDQKGRGSIWCDSLYRVAYPIVNGGVFLGTCEKKER